MSLFRCPICSAPLNREERAYTCPNRHSYDISKEGYTHLLPPNRKHSAAPAEHAVGKPDQHPACDLGYPPLFSIF